MRDQDTMQRDRSQPKYAPPQRQRPHVQPPHMQHHEPPVEVVQAGDPNRKAQGVRDLIGGGVLIGIGLAMGGSVFTGDPSALDWAFDILGTFWVVKGLYLLFT